MPSLRAKFFYRLLNAIPLFNFKSEEKLRRQVERNHRLGHAKPILWRKRGIQIRSGDFRRHKVYTAMPKDGESSGEHILYLHGGGYAFDMVGAHWGIIRNLIERTGAWVHVPIYPLSPEHSWREAHEMVMPLYLALADRFGADKITVAGDSAGGGFSVALAQMLRDRDKPLPARLVLFSPWLDGTGCDPEQPEIELRDPMLNLKGLRICGQWWAGGGDPARPEVSPLFGSLEGLPPMATWVGTNDILLADSRRLLEKATEQGEALTYYEYTEMVHVWMAFPIPEARKAFDEVALFMAKPAQREAAAPRAARQSAGREKSPRQTPRPARSAEASASG